MKVCIVVKNSIWNDPRVKKQINSYINYSYDVYCVGVTDPKLNQKEIEKLRGKVHLVKIDSKYYSENRTFITKIVREIKTNFSIFRKVLSAKSDVIHANDLNALIPCFFASKINRTFLIYDSHELFIENPWINRNKVTKFIWWIFEKALIRKVDIVVSVSNASSEYLSKVYKIEKPIVVTNSVLSSDIVELRTLNYLTFQILNHGQFYEGRGYELMIEVANRLRDYKDIEFIIRGYGQLESSLRNKIQSYSLKNIKIDPPVRIEELVLEASKSNLGMAITEAISKNFELSVSNKLFEYAAAGLPVIMSDIPEHRYLNEKYDFGVIVSDLSPSSIANAILDLYNNDEQYKRLSKNSITLSREMCWENEFEKLNRRIVSNINNVNSNYE